MGNKFYCENCGSEVPLNAKRCPSCSTNFDAVRCPSCGYEGDESAFEAGCPVCGYLGVMQDADSKKQSAKQRGVKKKEAAMLQQDQGEDHSSPSLGFYLAVTALLLVLIGVFFTLIIFV
ncbi:MAG: double zinc ribbon domain-containing protein [Spirochaetia bacterium]